MVKNKIKQKKLQELTKHKMKKINLKKKRKNVQTSINPEDLVLFA